MARIKKEAQCIIIFSQGGGLFAVESFSRPSQFHATDFIDQTCSCESATLSGNKKCRHLKYLDKLNKAGRLDSFV